MPEFISLSHHNLESEHICCAISDKKCSQGYELKKEWLKQQFENGYVFRKLNVRAKVFIEYGPSEYAWSPIESANHIMINCFWVSGKYKGNGYGKQLLDFAIADAKTQKKDGLLAIVGKKKFNFMADTRWLLKQGFEIVDTVNNQFLLLELKLQDKKNSPKFNKCAAIKIEESSADILVYYSNRCPFSEYHVKNSLIETLEKRRLSYKIIKIESYKQAQSCPSPATIFSLYYRGQFITTDISICMDSKFDKIISKHL